MKLCDVHTHILPDVDDGAPDMAYALQMLRNAAASNVEQLVITPHCNGPYNHGNYMDSHLVERFRQLQQAAVDIPVQLMLGSEVWINPDALLYLRQKRIPTMNGSRYVLIEFARDTQETTFIKVLNEILQEGYIPLVAHPERYEAVCRNPRFVESWLDLGCHIQLTGGSILGEYGKTIQRTSHFLLQQDLVACVASDAHGVNRRSNFLLDVYDHLSVWYSRQYAQCLMYTNPVRICNDEDL